MRYTLTTPCAWCPFLKSMRHSFSRSKLEQFAAGQFHCHQTGIWRDGKAQPLPGSLACAGALIFLEKRNRPNQLMRIMERLGLYDRSKLNMKAEVR